MRSALERKRHMCANWQNANSAAYVAKRCSQVVQQPSGTYTPQQHSLRVAPLFLEPLLAYLLYYMVLGCLSLYHRRDRRKLETLNSKMRKMVAELKVGEAWYLWLVVCPCRIRLCGCSAFACRQGGTAAHRIQLTMKKRSSFLRSMIRTLCRQHLGSSSYPGWGQGVQGRWIPKDGYVQLEDLVTPLDAFDQ